MRAERALLAVTVPVAVIATAIALRPVAPAAPPSAAAGSTPAPANVLAQQPVADAYAALRATEEFREQRFADAADPDAAAARRAARLAAGGTPEQLAALGLDLFVEHEDVTHRPLGATTRCAACHWRAGIGGAGGLVDDDLDDLHPPSLAGDALLERLGAEITADLARQRAAGAARLVSHGIDFGTPAHPSGLAADLVVRPFGAAARWATIDDAVDWMSANAIGRRATADERRALVAFVRSLPPPDLEPPDPARLPDLNRRFQSGWAIFDRTGCGGCHVRDLSLADGTRVQAFTDFKLHDMGVLGRVKTAPLWGLAADPPYLHDGRALNSIERAILFHDGDGADAAKRYAALSAADKGDLRLYLVSLAPKPRIRIAGP